MHFKVKTQQQLSGHIHISQKDNCEHSSEPRILGTPSLWQASLNNVCSGCPCIFLQVHSGHSWPVLAGFLFALSTVPRAICRYGFSAWTWSGSGVLGATPALSAQHRSKSPAQGWYSSQPAHWAKSGSLSARNRKVKKDLPKPRERCLQLLEIHICNSILRVSPYKLSSTLLVRLTKGITWPHKPVLPINTHRQKRLKRADSAQCSQGRTPIRLWSFIPLSLVLSTSVLSHIPLWTCPLTFPSCPYLQLHTLIIHWILLFFNISF